MVAKVKAIIRADFVHLQRERIHILTAVVSADVELRAAGADGLLCALKRFELAPLNIHFKQRYRFTYQRIHTCQLHRLSLDSDCRVAARFRPEQGGFLFIPSAQLKGEKVL